MLGVLWQRGRILSGKWHRTLAKNGSKLFILGYCNRGESGLESAGRKGCTIFKPGWWGGRVLVTRGSCWSEVKLLSRVRLFATPWTVANRAPPSMGFSRQEYWSGLPFPSPGELPDPGIEPKSPALQMDSLLLNHYRSPNRHLTKKIYRRQIRIWKDASHNMSLGKCKLK